MAGPAPSLPPLDITRAPEGGEIGPIQSGWRLAIREFASNRLAIAGVGVLAFFVLFCYLGPLFYHANLLTANLNVADSSPGPATCSGPTTRASTCSVSS